MKPIAIFRHLDIEGPGHFATFLDHHARPWRLIAVDEGQDIPPSAAEFSGLVFMGGPMSVNDDLPWIPPTLDLIRDAVAQDIPVLGHCLGGQLIAKALGGVVTAAPVKEIGWGEVQRVDSEEARTWLGDLERFQSFHWHGETFSIPQGATRILASLHCANQAFVMGPHLAMQCHVEMTEAMIRDWGTAGAAEIAAANSPAVQNLEQMLAQAPGLLPGLHKAAERIYAHWLKGLKD